jgi:hypothetical protein
MSLDDQVGLDLAVAVLETSTEDPRTNPFDVLAVAWLVLSQQYLTMAGTGSTRAAERERQLQQLERITTFTRGVDPDPAIDTFRRNGDWPGAVKYIRRALDDLER